MVVCLHRVKRGGGGLQHSCKTEGALVAVALEAFGAILREALIVLEARDEAAEAGPAGL